MSVVTICLGEPGTENYTGIVKFMDVLPLLPEQLLRKRKFLKKNLALQ